MRKQIGHADADNLPDFRYDESVDSRPVEKAFD